MEYAAKTWNKACWRWLYLSRNIMWSRYVRLTSRSIWRISGECLRARARISWKVKFNLIFFPLTKNCNIRQTKTHVCVISIFKIWWLLQRKELYRKSVTQRWAKSNLVLFLKQANAQCVLMEMLHNIDTLQINWRFCMKRSNISDFF